MRHDRARPGGPGWPGGARPRDRVRDLAAGARAGARRGDGHRRQQVGRHAWSATRTSRRRSISTPGKTGGEAGVWLHLVTKPKPEAKPDPKADPKTPAEAGDAARAAAARSARRRQREAPLRAVRAAGVAARVRRARRRQAQGAGPRQPEAQARRDREGRGPTLRDRTAGDASRRRGLPARHPRRARLPDAAQRAERAAERAATWSIAACTRSSSPTSIGSSCRRAARRRSSCRSAASRAQTIGFAPAKTPDKKRSDGQELARRALAPVPDRAARQGRGAHDRQGRRSFCASTTPRRARASGGSRSAAPRRPAARRTTRGDRRSLRPQRAHGGLGEDSVRRTDRSGRAEADRRTVARIPRTGLPTLAFLRTGCAELRNNTAMTSGSC